MHHVLAIGWNPSEFVDIIAKCSSDDIAFTIQYDSENLSSNISREFQLVIINGFDHLKTHRKIADLIQSTEIETVVFLNEAESIEEIDKPNFRYTLRTNPVSNVKILQCLENSRRSNRRDIDNLSSPNNFKKFLKLFQKTVTHEFNTPINVINSSLHILKNHASKLDRIEIDEQFEFISNATKRMEKLIGDFRLEFDLTNKVSKPRIGPLEIGEAIESATSIFKDSDRLIIGQKSTPLYGLADSRLLSEAIQRVTQNALENSKANVSIKLVQSDGWIQIAIEDQGTGIDESISKSIFKPYTRYGNEDGKQGIGLGLAISKKCMEAIGGGIDFTSKSGKGSCFVLHLHVAPENQYESYFSPSI